MTQIHTQSGWRDEALDAREGLGRNAAHYAALSDHMIKRQRRQTRRTGIVTALAAVGAVALAMAIWGAM